MIGLITSMLDSFGINNSLPSCWMPQRLLKPGSATVLMAVQLSYCPIELLEWYEVNSTLGTSSRH